MAFFSISLRASLFTISFVGVVIFFGHPARGDDVEKQAKKNSLAKSKVARCNQALERDLLALEKNYATLKDLKGEFKQVYSDAVYHRDSTSYGYVYFRRGGMMRWDYASPEKKAFVSDGKSLWVWEAESNQVIRNDLADANFSTGLEFLVGEVKIRDRFAVSCATDADAKKMGSIDDHVLMLVPNIPQASFEYLLIIADSAASTHSKNTRNNMLIREAMLVGDFGSNHFMFSNLKKNSNLAKKRFQFRTPKHARSIDASTVMPAASKQNAPETKTESTSTKAK